jgi:putative FmdB family regulatory protein
MPIYEYECRNCGHHLEALQKVSEAPLKKCPECGKPTLQKLVSAAGFRLKGGGWYETDFKSGHRRNVLDSGDKPKAEGKDKEKKPAETVAAKSDKPKSEKPKSDAKSETKKTASSGSS